MEFSSSSYAKGELSATGVMKEKKKCLLAKTSSKESPPISDFPPNSKVLIHEEEI